MTEETQIDETETRAMLVECLHGEMRDAILDEIQAAPDVWQKMPQAKQEEVIGRVDKRVTAMLRDALDVLVGYEFPVATAHLEQVTVKEGIKAVVTMSKHSPDRHAIIDSVGYDVRLAIADPEMFAGQPGKVTSEPDQREIPDASTE